MPDKEIQKQYQLLKFNLSETRVRIRRYTFDPRLKDQEGEADDTLRKQIEAAWTSWLKVRDQFVALPDPPTVPAMDAVERSWLELDREVDLIQRELITEKSRAAGIRTVIWLTAAMLALILFYLLSHGVRGLDFTPFETWPEWGPLKYAEVACWSAFGVFCYLLYTVTNYIARRDFDEWYQPWYVSSAIRGVFFTVILMMIVLELTELYGEGTWVQTYLLEEGNKYYFIVFMSFCLGLSSNSTAAIMGDLSDGVTEFVSRAVGNLSKKLSLAVTKTDLGGK